MDDFLMYNSSYLSEDIIRSFTVPTFIPSVVYSGIGIIITFAFFEKFVRKAYFVPYLYCGFTSLFYTLAHVFLLIFVEEERTIRAEEGSATEDKSHETALYASLIMSSIGSFFLNLVLFRLLEVWIRVGQKKHLNLSKHHTIMYMLFFSVLPLVLSLVGDVMLVQETTVEDESINQINDGLSLKLVSAVMNIMLTLLYLVVCVYCAWSIYGTNLVIMSMQNQASFTLQKLIVEEKTEQDLICSRFRRVVYMLLGIGLLALGRFVFDVIVAADVIISGPTWNAATYLVLVVTDGIILLLVVYISDLKRVENAVIYEQTDMFNMKKEFSNSMNFEEIIPLSRSPITVEEER